jgi:hypothetical protein
MAMNLDAPARGLLVDPLRDRVSQEQAVKAAGELHKLLAAVETVDHRTHADAHRGFTANSGGSVRQALRAMAVDATAVARELDLYDKADRMVLDTDEHADRLAETEPPAWTGDPLVRAKQLLPDRYRTPEGAANFALDSSYDDDLIGSLERRARREKAGAIKASFRNRVARTVNLDAPADGRRRMLDSMSGEGIKQLDQALGNTRRLVQPAGYTGGLRELEASIAAANRVIALQAGSSAADGGAGVDGDLDGAVSALHRHLQTLATSPATDRYDLVDRVRNFHRSIGGRP